MALVEHALHAWNRDFRWPDHTESPSWLEAEQVQRFDRDGYFVLESAFDLTELAPVVAELDRFETRADTFLRERGGRLGIAESGAITFAPNLTGRSPLLAAFAAHPVLLALCRDLIGEDVNLYWDQAVYKKPEKPRRFPWHQDNGYKFVLPQTYLTCWIALSDATLENGCPHVAPGLHRLGTLRHRYVEPLGWECFEKPPASAAAPVRAGGIVVFSSLTPHLTGPNTTGGVRKAYIVQYAPAGAVALVGDPSSNTPPERVPQDDPRFQFPVLRQGEAVKA
jgi:ectoine hydroxylase-related dioxygenase (phytanoyl-CoA dioxygenase family)